jgi:rare lipoprotein A
MLRRMVRMGAGEGETSAVAWGVKRGAWANVARLGAAAVCLLLAHCSGSDFHQIDPLFGFAANPRFADFGGANGGGSYLLGKPYVVGNRRYVPQENTHYRAEGLASWYGPDFHGQRTANGEVFNMYSMSAAHPTLPLPSYVRVTNLNNGRSVVLRANDRGPYHRNRIIDVSVKAADMLGFSKHGTARVRVEYVGLAPLEGSDDGALMATLRQGEPAPAPSLVMVASASPFLPRIRTAGPVEGPVPMPPDRPYALSGLQ